MNYELTHYRTEHEVGFIQSDEDFNQGDRFFFFCLRNKKTLDIKVLKRKDIPGSSKLWVAVMNEKHNGIRLCLVAEPLNIQTKH